ncbi:MAG: indole-3-glycerol phosphate synthase TrpC [Candidatus Nanopelagicales bacterium]|jgi:indole-3-glycerol phosphate synthase|nr:indole-3-glycerol phosphate synthase TrpC [Candidatus Nanopelagicales bacterium]
MSVLDDIIVGVREDTAFRKQSVSLADLKAQVSGVAPALPVVPSLKRGGVQLIAEVKRSSPSKGALADIADPAALASAYEDGGASAISVLTEQRRFGGSLADLDAVRAAVRIPILRKDFMVEEYQFWEARAHGADIILLIVAGLEQTQLVEFMGLTSELGMTALVETHDEAEIARALDAGAQVVGVNARNLKTLEVDRDVFARVAHLIPETCVRIAESGVRSPEDVLAYGVQGADVVLVGEALVTGSDPQAAARAMIEAGATIGKAS